MRREENGNSEKREQENPDRMIVLATMATEK